MTEGKQRELLDMVSAAEAEAKSARLKVAAAERARAKDKQEAEERYSRLEADLVSKHGTSPLPRLGPLSDPISSSSCSIFSR